MYFPKAGFKSIALQQKEARLRTVFEKGRKLHQMGDLKLAREAYQSVLNEDPAHFDAMHLMGVVCAQSQEYELAIDLFSRALTINKKYPVAYNNLGNAQAAMRDWSAAVQSYDQAIKRDPRYALAYFNRGIAQEELGFLEPALASYQNAIDIDPQHVPAYLNCGVVLQKLGRIQEALSQYGVAIALDPEFADAYYNRGTDFMELALLHEAIRDFDKAISIRSGYADAYWNKSLTLLCMGNWAAAWDIYDWRWQRSDLDPNAFRPPLNPQRFQIAANPQTPPTVFLWSEQGVGDEVFHSSMLDDAARRFGSVTMQVDGRLIPLLQRSIPGVHFVDKESPVDLHSFDLHFAHGDLGYFFRRNASDFQSVRRKYLYADQSRVKALQSQLKTDMRPLIGITWRSKNTRLGGGKSINLEQLLPVLSNPSFQFVSLQYGDTRDELAAFHQRFGISIASCLSVDNFSDLDGHAALIEACDSVLTVSNTSAHIAGALGKPTCVMLSKGEGRLWYWANRQDRRSMWYPAVEIFEQAVHTVWEDVVADIQLNISEKCRDQ